MGKVRIFCDCGKEIWGAPEAVVRSQPVRIPDVEREAICSDCLMEKSLRETRPMERIRL